LGRKGKRKLLTWRGGYHGDTFQPMSVSDPDGGMHSLWRGTLTEQVFVPAPPAGFGAELDQSYVNILAAAIKEHADELAAVIVEPVAQGAGGMRFHNPGYLRALRELTEKHGVLLIFDEIATGFGRTGTLFAAGHASVTPDVMCVGKALTGGYLTMAAALCTPEIADGISRGEMPVLAHGPTFMGNPLASAVANASLGLLRDGDWAADVRRIETGLTEGLEEARSLASAVDVRVLGAIGVIQLDHPVDVVSATQVVTEHGVWLRPFRDLIYAMPPYVSEDADVRAITQAMVAAAEKA
jgi:adenosylmethionine-8-amino-7-oxononanoate aminotransferase